MDTSHFVTAINAACFELFCPNFGNSSNRPKVVPSGQSSLAIGLHLPSGREGLLAATLVNANGDLNEHRIVEIHGSGPRCNADCVKWRIRQHVRNNFMLENASPSSLFRDVAYWGIERELKVITAILQNMVESGGSYDSTSIMEELRKPVDTRFDNGERARRKQVVDSALNSQHYFGSPALKEHIKLLREEFAEL